jgi:hypothetical protein
MPSRRCREAPCEPRSGPDRRRPRESPRDWSRREAGTGSRPSRGPKRGSSRGFGLEGKLRESGEAFGRSRDPKGISQGFGPGRFPEERRASARRFSKGRPERLRPRCEPWRRRGFGRAGSAREATAGISVQAHATRRESAWGLAPPCRDPPDAERGLAASLRDPGESEAGRARLAIPKPPSERWPRHPATAVKAGTSGGRWRHRPPF